MSEIATLREIMRDLGRGAVRLWRNNVGTGWAGKAQKITRAMTVMVFPGDVVVRNARPLHAGLCEGSSDLIGLRTVEVTPNMIGRRLAVFVACEVKSGDGRVRKGQANFLDFVRGAGGIAVLARSSEEASRAILGDAQEKVPAE